MHQQFTMHSDASHAWIEVPTALLARLGVQDFTRWSYLSDNGATAYLEEDADAPRFARAYCKALDLELRQFWAEFITEIPTQGAESFVRRLQQYPQRAAWRSMGQSVGA